MKIPKLRETTLRHFRVHGMENDGVTLTFKVAGEMRTGTVEGQEFSWRFEPELADLEAASSEGAEEHNDAHTCAPYV